MAKKTKKKNTKRKPIKIEFWLIITFVSLALLISIEQYISWGKFFEFKDIHHEMFIVMFMFGALSVAFLYHIKKQK